jgi:ABC-type multidrug transport system ATPase subunit
MLHDAASQPTQAARTKAASLDEATPAGETLAEAQHHESRRDGSGLVIKTNGLTRRFGTHVAVRDVGLRVPERSIYGFLGHNGAGKSTTIRLLLGLLTPDEGDVRLFGTPLPVNRAALLRRVGALIEAPSLYEHLTGRENLEFTRCLCGASLCTRQKMNGVGPRRYRS